MATNEIKLPPLIESKIEELKLKIKSLFPNSKKIGSIYLTDIVTYRKMYTLLRKFNNITGKELTPDEFIQYLGFNSHSRDDYIKGELKKAYGKSKEISKIRTEHRCIYEAIFLEAKKNGISINKYLESIGYRYRTKSFMSDEDKIIQKYDRIEKKIKYDLSVIAKNNKIEKITEHKAIYIKISRFLNNKKKIAKFSKKNHITPTDYIKSLGYELL